MFPLSIQFLLTFNLLLLNGAPSFATDDECFYVKDIAKYLYDKYSKESIISIETIYADLDQHPIFPSDGYKRDIKKELNLLYDVKISKDGQFQIAFHFRVYFLMMIYHRRSSKQLLHADYKPWE